jgi:hypothetical protein
MQGLAVNTAILLFSKLTVSNVIEIGLPYVSTKSFAKRIVARAMDDDFVLSDILEL